MNAVANRLYDLLPAVYRLRDADRGLPLKALLDAIGGEVDLIEDDIAKLYDNWFIETCDEWVVPYIGDLVGVRPIHAVPSAAVSTRAYVANTIAYRRRKGTALVLEQLARDVTGWPAHAVEFFQLLATTQNLNHVRPRPTGAPSLRNAAVAELAGTAFDEFAHLPDMRNIERCGGRYNVSNLGLFLWRLQSYPLGDRAAGVAARDFCTARRIGAAGTNVFSFHPAGIDSPLFNPAVAEHALTHLAEEHNVPGPLRLLALDRDLEIHRRRANAVGEEAQVLAASLRFLSLAAPAFRVFVELVGSPGLTEIPAPHIYMCALPPAALAGSPREVAVAVDPARGRLRFADDLQIKRVLTCFSFGFPGDGGGGPYERAESIAAANAMVDEASNFTSPDWHAGVSHLGETGLPSTPVFSDLRSAVAAWNALPHGRTGVITIMDSVTDVPGGAASPSLPIDIRIGERSKLMIVAASWPKDDGGNRHRGLFDARDVRPHILGDIAVHGIGAADTAGLRMLFLNGLLLEGSIAADGELGLLSLQHCTLIPGHGGLQIQTGNEGLRLRVERSIVGGIGVAPPIAALEISDSIVQADATSPMASVAAAETACNFESTTFVGAVSLQSLSASNCIFVDPVVAARRQIGCVRFSYVPAGSMTPRRYECQPSDTADQAALKPLFVSLRYGDPAYGQLDRRCPSEIYQGADDGSEMGFYRFLQQPQREENLRTVLSEYLPFVMQAGSFFAT